MERRGFLGAALAAVLALLGLAPAPAGPREVCRWTGRRWQRVKLPWVRPGDRIALGDVPGKTWVVTSNPRKDQRGHWEVLADLEQGKCSST